MTTTRTAAPGEFKVMLVGPEGIDLALKPDGDEPTIFFFDRLMDTIRFVQEQQGRDLYYYSFDDDRGWVTTRLESVKVYQQGVDKSDEFRELLGSRTAADLPSGLRFENPKPNQVVAYDDDNPDPWLARFGVGVLSWDDNGVISWVAIQDDTYKRRGIATAMLEYARTIRPDIKHSDELSDSGSGWAQAVGSRTAAEPGGVLPWTPSTNGYYWITKNDDSLEAVTNDGVNRMRLYEKPWGWEWVVRDSMGVVEKGNFGSAMQPDALRDRADDLLSEFDSRPLRRTRGPSRGYQDDYTQAPNQLWGSRMALYHETGNSTGVAVVLTFPEEVSESLAMPDGTPPDEIHITLGYFGSTDEMDPDAEDDLRVICEYMATQFAGFTVNLGGLIRFSGEGQDAFVLNADSPLVNEMRDMLVVEIAETAYRKDGSLAIDTTHGFTPHCTLGYLDPTDPLPFDRWEPVEVPVVSIELWYGTDRYAYPLGAESSRQTTSKRYAQVLRERGIRR